MVKEYADFLYILQNFVSEQKTSNLNLNIERIIETAKRQNLEGIVYYQIAINELRNSFYSSIARYGTIIRIKEEITNYLDEAGIEFYFIKGVDVAQCYPIPQLRTMGDLDLIIHIEDNCLVKEKLLSKGFICVSEKEDHEIVLIKYGIMVEIHYHIISKDVRNTDEMVRFGDDMWNHIYKHQLTWEEHFIYILIHLRKHIMGQGAGIRLFLDVGIIIKNVQMDWEKILGYIHDLGMIDFFYRVLQYIEYAFSIGLPIEVPQINANIAEYITDKLFTDGIFGKFDDNNLKNYLVNNINYTGKSFLIKRFFSAVFLPLRQMRSMKEYSYLKDRPILLPWAWFVRIIRKKRNKQGIKKECFEIESYLQKRNTLFSIWGIKSNKRMNE